MDTQTLTLGFTERVSVLLRGLYDRHGYTQYKMNKFEEYDLYARNKDFLISDHVITFTDLNGRLMALKPDVTLSIVKNSRDGETLKKLYYNENVYRVAKGDRGFREIMQVGLECLGAVDDCCVCEVLELAAESLRLISGSSILGVGHLGLLSGLASDLGFPQERMTDLFRCVGEKNAHELGALCQGAGLPPEGTALLKQLIALSGPPAKVLPRIREMLAGVTDLAPAEELETLVEALDGSPAAEVLRIDFSVVDDIHYYNGIVFKGFIRGLPGSVLSGGQYDRLMGRMRRSARAIGFAIYMDQLERLEEAVPEYDADTLVLYGENTPLKQIRETVRALIAGGERVIALPGPDPELRCRRVLKLGSEVK